MIPLLAALLGAPAEAALARAERERLRFQLENLWNEVDLIVKNQRADDSDVRRQEREMKIFRLNERIPMTFSEAEFREDLRHSAAERGVKVQSLKVTDRSKPGKAIPLSIKTHDSSFRIARDQLIEEIRFLLVLEGEESAARTWATSWHEPGEITEPSSPRRLVQAAPLVNGLLPLRKIGERRWELTGRTFRFREIRFPKLIPREPREILPGWALKDREKFARSEPLLWNYVSRIESRLPEARPLYRTREQFQLNAARLRFFTETYPD